MISFGDGVGGRGIHAWVFVSGVKCEHLQLTEPPIVYAFLKYDSWRAQKDGVLQFV